MGALGSGRSRARLSGVHEREKGGLWLGLRVGLAPLAVAPVHEELVVIGLDLGNPPEIYFDVLVEKHCLELLPPDGFREVQLGAL
eukprot:1305272-Pyramimonas_sp.AAC.1